MYIYIHIYTYIKYISYIYNTYIHIHEHIYVYIKYIHIESLITDREVEHSYIPPSFTCRFQFTFSLRLSHFFSPKRILMGIRKALII